MPLPLDLNERAPSLCRMLGFMILSDITSSISQLVMFVLHEIFFPSHQLKKKKNVATLILQNQQCRNDISGSERRLDSPPPPSFTPGQECSVKTTAAKPNASPLSPNLPLAGARGSALSVPMTYCLCVLQLKVTHCHSTSSPPAGFLILIPQCCLLI